MPNFAYVENGQADPTPSVPEWHIGHAIGLLMADPAVTGKYTVEVSDCEGVRTCKVHFGMNETWRVHNADLDQTEVSDGETSYVLQHGAVVEQAPLRSYTPIEVYPAYPRLALIWGRNPWDEWRLREGVEKHENILTAHLERRLTPEHRGVITLDVDSGFMLTMDTPNSSIKINNFSIEHLPPDIFSTRQ